jgi:hypothetical protein
LRVLLFLPTKSNCKRRLSREIESFSAKLTCSNHHGSDKSGCVNIFVFIKASGSPCTADAPTGVY